MIHYGNVFFQKPVSFLKDSHFGKEDINIDVDTGIQMFVEGKSAMFHGHPTDYAAAAETDGCGADPYSLLFTDIG